MALLSPELSAQKGSPNSIRTVYRAKECPEDYITALPGLALGEIVYQGKHWFTDWIRLSPDGSTTATYESSDGEYLISTDGTKQWNQPRLTMSCWEEEWVNLISGVHYWYTTYTDHTASGSVVDTRPPKPRISMNSASQQSGDAGTLTISAGHSVTLSATTTDYGYPAATVNDHDWSLDGTQLGTGASTSTVPGYGSHTVHLTLANSAGQGEATATIIVVAPDEEAGACDDPLTDVVEEECDDGNNGPYAVQNTVGAGGGSTRWCLVNQWYDWNPATEQYEYWYTEELYCWYEE
jgi:hypothetical protein